MRIVEKSEGARIVEEWAGIEEIKVGQGNLQKILS